ncbi:MAG: DUF4919 domain-containing protein, partial [Sphingobacteriales bacterium]
MRTVILLFLLPFCACAQAQDMFDYHRDFDRMVKESQDSKHPHYYPTLLKRYNSNDTTLSNAEILAFMVGFTRQPAYLAKDNGDREEKIMDYVRNDQYTQAIEAANKLLAAYPMNFTAAMEKSFSVMKLKQDSAVFYKQRFMSIQRAIRASGDGSREHPYFILGANDGNLLVNFVLGGEVGMLGTGRDEHGNLIEMIEMTDRKEKDKPSVYVFFITDQRGTQAIDAQVDAAVEEIKKEQKA